MNYSPLFAKGSTTFTKQSIADFKQVNSKGMKTEIIVAFSIGRGGRFNNQGHTTYLGEHRISTFTEDLFPNYVNESTVLERFKNTEHEDEILDLLTDRNLDRLLELGVTEQDLGEIEYFKDNGNSSGLTEKECHIGVGYINIDYDYDSTYTRLIEDCNEKEIQLIIESDEYKSSQLEEYLHTHHV